MATEPTRTRRARALALATSATLAGLIWSVMPSAPAGATPTAPAVAPAAAPSARMADPIASVAGSTLQSLMRFVRTGDATANARYVARRAELASAVAGRLGIPASVLRDAWARTSVRNQTAIIAGLAQLGVPYRSMGSTPEGGFDCSGFTSYAWRAAGVELPRTSGDQIRFGGRRDVATAMAGDLTQYPGHVMMYLGVPGAVLHSPYTGTVVRVEMLSGSRAARLRYASPTG